MNIWYAVNMVRSIPALLMFRRLPCRREIQEDLRQCGCEIGSWWDLHCVMMNDHVFRNLFYCRTHKDAPIMTKLSKIFYPLVQTTGVEAERIGGGMKIWHGFSTIVFAKEIGKNFTVYQQVSIGRGKMIDGNDIPVIGDNVTVYAGAIVVGGIHIGNNVSIGAGAVVVKDVPDNTTVVGAPVRYISKASE